MGSSARVVVHAGRIYPRRITSLLARTSTTMRTVLWTIVPLSRNRGDGFGPSLVNSALSKVILPEHDGKRRVLPHGWNCRAVMVGLVAAAMCGYLPGDVVPKEQGTIRR